MSSVLRQTLSRFPFTLLRLPLFARRRWRHPGVGRQGQASAMQLCCACYALEALGGSHAFHSTLAACYRLLVLVCHCWLALFCLCSSQVDSRFALQLCSSLIHSPLLFLPHLALSICSKDVKLPITVGPQAPAQVGPRGRL